MEPIVRVALIPDRFSDAASARTDLGAYDSNVLTVRADAPEGQHVLVDDSGDEFVLYVPPPWVDPMAASRPDPSDAG